MAPLMPASAAQLDQNRQDLLEWLYELDGRDDPAHPWHAHYTGLHQAMADHLGRAQLAALAQGWHALVLPAPGEPLHLRCEVTLQRTAERR